MEPENGRGHLHLRRKGITGKRWRCRFLPKKLTSCQEGNQNLPSFRYKPEICQEIHLNSPKDLGTCNINPRLAVAPEYPAGWRTHLGKCWEPPALRQQEVHSRPTYHLHPHSNPASCKAYLLTIDRSPKAWGKEFSQVQKWVSKQVKPWWSHSLECTRELQG